MAGQVLYLFSGAQSWYLNSSAFTQLSVSYFYQAEEKKLELAEQYLEEDAAMFDEFLKENDKNSVEAIKM